MPLIANRISGKTIGEHEQARWRTRARDRAPRDRRDLLEQPRRERLRRAGDGASGAAPRRVHSSGLAAAPSSLRPVLARNTSSSEGWWSWSGLDVQIGLVEHADDLGELGLAAGQLHGDAAAAVAAHLAEAARAARASRSPVAGVGGRRPRRSGCRSPP